MAIKHDSSTRILTFVLTVTFGLVAVVIAYATFKGGSFELRSKAAQEEVVLKQWTFDANAEGWNQKDFLSGVVTGGKYQLTVNPQKQTPDNKEQCKTINGKRICTNSRVMREVIPQITNTTVQTHLKYPVNKFRIRLAASSLTSGIIRTAEKSDANSKILPPSKEQQATPFTLKVTQKYQGKTLLDTEQQISAVADGKEHEYSFEFTKSSSLKRVDELQITFVGLNTAARTTVMINDIALIGMRATPPPQPTKSPQKTQTLNGFVRRRTADINTKVPQYTLEVSEGARAGDTKNVMPTVGIYKGLVYLLVEQSGVNPCGEGRAAQLMCRYLSPQRKINFEQYVDRYVMVTGSVVDAQGKVGETKPRTQEEDSKTAAMNSQFPNPSALPTFMVTSISLVNIVKDTPPPPSPVVSQYPTSISPPTYTSISPVQ